MTGLHGKFIVFDGPEGSGKSTQSRLLRERLAAQGLAVKLFRDPGSSRIGEQVRAILLNPDHIEMGMRCEMLLYMAARAQMMHEMILPALAAGDVVLCDRFVSSTLAYQLDGDGLTSGQIKQVADIAISQRWPDLVFTLDMPAKRALARVQREMDRIEQRPPEYHERVRQNYLAQANADPAIYRIVNADRPREAVHQDIVRLLSEALGVIMPDVFAHILGQQPAIEMLSSAYDSGRLPHALIFAGPAGVGKATTAKALATLFLCEKPRGTAACGKCQSCTLMAADTHADYHRVYRQLIRFIPDKEESKARDLAIDVVREHLVRAANLKTIMGRGKVFIVEEAELMNPAAQNALLKVLEEPPGRALTVLLTEQPEALLATIRSRCQLVRFAPLEEKVILTELNQRGIDREVAHQASRFAGGSLGLALRWIEDGVVEAAGELERQFDELLAGRALAQLQEWLKKAGEAYATKQLERDENASRDQAVRDGSTLYLKIASQLLGRALAQEDNPQRMERICTAIETIVRAEGYLDANVSVPLTLQQVAVGLDGALVEAR